jgi:hypothetical protein
MGERNWLLEEMKNTHHDGDYAYSDNPLGNELDFSKSEFPKIIPRLKRDWSPTFQGAYG